MRDTFRRSASNLIELVETRPELATPPDPNMIRVGRFGVTRAGLVVLVVLGTALLGGAIVMTATRSGGARRFALGAWVAVCTSAGFLLFFVGLAYNDYRSYIAYRETSCHVFASTIDKLQSRNSESGTSYTYKPEFAVSYTVLGTETYASVVPPASAISRNSIGPAQRQLERFALGSVQPCWYDPADPGMVLLMRGPGAAYLFALLPLAALILFTWILRGQFPSRGPTRARGLMLGRGDRSEDGMLRPAISAVTSGVSLYFLR